MDRRDFIKAGAGAFFIASADRVLGAGAPSNRVRLAIVGCHEKGRGQSVLKAAMQHKGVDIAYVCDVDSRARDWAAALVEEKTGLRPRKEPDFRKILEDPLVDGIISETPDHFHAYSAIQAMKAGKAVYVEKPCGYCPRECELIIETQKRTGRVFQMGNQRRASPSYQEAIAILQSPDSPIGRLRWGKCWYMANRKSIGRGKACAVPDWLDWDLWQGPAPRTEFHDNYVHYNWHWFRRWGTAETGNNAPHFADVARGALGGEYPELVTCSGGQLFDRDDEAYHDRAAPIVKVYHYRGQYMSLYWDMVDENPIFTDAERRLVAKTLYDQLVYRLTRADYTNPYRNYDKPALVRPDRHYCWEVLQAYTTARYLHKNNPCFETSEGLRMGKNAMEPLLKKQVIGNIALFWVPTSMELQFYYAAVNGNRFIDNPLLREYANCLTLLSTLDYGSDARIEVYGSPWLYLCGAFFAQDQAMFRLALNKTKPGSFAAKAVQDYDVFRVGQSYWPTKPYLHDSVKEHLGKWNTFATYIPQTPDKQEVLFTSYRTKPDNTGDFMLVDPH